MTFKNRLKKLEKPTSLGGRACISAYSEEELEKKLAEYKQKNPYSADPNEILITRTIIKSRADLENDYGVVDKN